MTHEESLKTLTQITLKNINGNEDGAIAWPRFGRDSGRRCSTESWHGSCLGPTQPRSFEIRTRCASFKMIYFAEQDIAVFVRGEAIL
jgi:hypothetical protein